ncbi:MAG: Leucine rich repeat [Bacteroidota bacterium]
MKKIVIIISIVFAVVLSENCSSNTSVNPKSGSAYRYADTTEFLSAMYKHFNLRSRKPETYYIRAINFNDFDSFRMLPKEIKCCKYLMRLYVGNKPEWNMKQTWATIGLIPSLREIYVTHTPQFKVIPKEILKLPELGALHLKDNNITTIPRWLLSKESLEVIDLTFNPISTIDIDGIKRKKLLTLHIDSCHAAKVVGKKFENIKIVLGLTFGGESKIYHSVGTLLGDTILYKKKHIQYTYPSITGLRTGYVPIEKDSPIWNDYQQNRYVGKKYLVKYVRDEPVEAIFYRIYLDQPIK